MAAINSAYGQGISDNAGKMSPVTRLRKMKDITSKLVSQVKNGVEVKHECTGYYMKPLQLQMELNLPLSTVHKVLDKNLRLVRIQVQLVELHQPDDRPRRSAFAVDKLARIDDEEGFLRRVVFSDEAAVDVQIL
ncbi:hypothetical protein ANN_24938 [Periplaneta americana]|uniref:Uncharacterized protein n=1 Tax=Periplaneta americana TaxID=6978 RepID=A0ABQ8S000_PERAM|nr:hypothetical protein ANN_24938 [Periplaneta americana]